MELGQRLRDLRKRLNLTQKELAQKIKTIDYTYIGKIERGEQDPSLKMIRKIACSLNIKLEFFFSEKPVDVFLSMGSKNVNNTKRENILNLLLKLKEEELNFIIGIIKFLLRYKDVKYIYKPLKAAEKKDLYNMKFTK